ncbi:MAG: CRTAC1 family protein, partial [Planctomycetota bacterium]
RADGSFEERAQALGLGLAADDYGVACADANDDGALDLVLLGREHTRLYRGSGDGRFELARDAASFAPDDWSVAGAWLDYDRDGDLDLFVVNYVRWNPDTTCIGGSGQVDYCGPDAFDPWPDVLYANDGSGTFTNVTAEAGVERPGSGLGVVTADLTEDGWVDIYVANDMRENHLWVNRTDGTFREEGMLRGVGVNGTGRPEASMGVCLDDIDHDGRLDLFMTHIQGQTNTIYSTLRGGLWSDVTARGGMGAFDMEATGFGCAFFDLEHDGDLDLVVANGRVYRQSNALATDLGPFWSNYGESDSFYTNDGRGRFTPQRAAAVDLTGPSRVSRGLAVGDLDGDGDVDMVLSALGNRLRIFENTAGDGHWLRVDARLGADRRSALGAEIEVTVNGRSQRRVLTSTYSYGSASEPIVHFGLGSHATYDALRVVWPDGTEESFPGGEADRTVVLLPVDRTATR